MTFNLLQEPWVSVIYQNGSAGELSLKDCFAQSDQVRKLSGDIPTQAFAILRLMLAICHDAIGFHDEDDIAKVLDEGIDLDAVIQYLEKYEDRFDLFNKTRPFFQISGLCTPKGSVSGLEKLIADVPNGEPFLTVRGGQALEKISAAEAARWLVHCQAFDPSGIRTGVEGDPEAKGGKSYPIGPSWVGQIGGVALHGQNLRQTLAYNLVPTTRNPEDRPVWAGPEPVGVSRPTVVSVPGPVSVLTWQSRWIRLIGDRDGVTGVVLSNGHKMTPQNRHDVEFMTSWRYSKPQTAKFKQITYMPSKHDIERSAWRGVPRIIGSLPVQKAGDPEPLRPATVDNLASFAESHDDIDLSVIVEVVGMEYGGQEATVEELVCDSLDLNISILGKNAVDVRVMVNDAVTLADKAVWTLGQLAGNIAKAAGDFDGVEGAQGRVMLQGWAALDSPAREWIADLRSNSDTVDESRKWQRLVSEKMLNVANQLLNTVSSAAVTGRKTKYGWMTAAKAEAVFRSELRSKLPLAFEEKDKETKK